MLLKDNLGFPTRFFGNLIMTGAATQLVSAVPYIGLGYQVTHKKNGIRVHLLLTT
jgi:hypothetical protein